MQIPYHAPEAALSRVDLAGTTPRPLRIAEWVLLSLLLVEFGAHSLPNVWRTLNTDFPNYYLTARLAHEHFDTSRVYEWIWIERQKDHHEIDRRLVGMVPITAFSTLAVYPLTSLPPLEAKRVWTALNLGFLLAAIWLLVDLTGLPLRRIALLVALSHPLRVNLMFGQFYVLLLFLLTLACWLYARQRRFLSGMPIGVAAGLKVFPVIFLLYFLRKRDWRAFAGGVLGGALCALASIVTFGWQLHGVYLKQILPSVLRGEGLDPYNLIAASLSSLLHRLLIYEPQLNPHPALNAAWLFAVLHPLLQMAVVAPAILLAIPRGWGLRRIHVEWAAILLASLAISTSASAYLFTVLILPACLLLKSLPENPRHVWAAVLVILYVAVGNLSGTDVNSEGWRALLCVPRLYAAVLLCLFAYWLLKRQSAETLPRWDRMGWAAALGALLLFNIASNLRHQRGLYDDYRSRVEAPEKTFMDVHPAVQRDALLFIALRGDGYHSGIQADGVAHLSDTSSLDRLSLAADNDVEWVEEAGRNSVLKTVAYSGEADNESIVDAESPVFSSDGKRLAYLREDRGRGQIWIHGRDGAGGNDIPITPSELNVLEMSFLASGSSGNAGDLIFSAQSDGKPSLFTVDGAGHVKPLDTEEARYPAVSPDGRWLAYSAMASGSWNLRLRDLSSGQIQELTHAQCNATEPAWNADSKTLYYASDCGRTLWFSAICKRRVIP